MLAQNFKSAADLGITEPQLSALQKTLVLLETGKLQHVPMGFEDYESRPVQFSGQFNMNQWRGENECGTVCCIGGTAELVGQLKPRSLGNVSNAKLQNLFYPDTLKFSLWESITTAQAATALRSYLTTGDARWDLAVAS